MERPGPIDERASTVAAVHEGPGREPMRDLVRVAARAFAVQGAAIIESCGRKARVFVGHGLPDGARRVLGHLLHHPIATGRTLVVPDITACPERIGDPLGGGPAPFRFFAAAPILAANGEPVAALCLLDPEPRAADEADLRRDLKVHTRLAAMLLEDHASGGDGVAEQVIRATTDAIIAADEQGRIIEWNPAAEAMFGYAAEEAIGRNVSLIIPERFREAHCKGLERMRAGAPSHIVGGDPVELEAIDKEGREFPIELSLARWQRHDSRDGFAAIIRNIAARKALEAECASTRAFLNSVISNLPVALFVKDVASRRYVLANQKAEDLLGGKRPLTGLRDRDLHPGVGPVLEARDLETISTRQPTVNEQDILQPNGERLHLKITRVLTEAPDGEGRLILGIAENLTDIRRTEAENYRLARFDSLTGLLNRKSLAEVLEGLTAGQDSYALLYIDLDRFKAVNDKYGHQAGDRVLEEVGARMREEMGENDCVARVGGDEFIAVLTGHDLRFRCDRLAAALIKAIAEPIDVGRISVSIGASIGSAIFPDDGLDSNRIRENADLALYRAKQEGRDRYCAFNLAMDTAAKEKIELEADFQAALKQDGVTLNYQPIVSAATQEIVSVEALARWVHPTRGRIAPDTFIPIAEEAGLIEELGRRVLERACADARGWDPGIAVSVNISPHQFESETIVPFVKQALERTGLPPHRLHLEVTERVVIKNVECVFKQLADLRALGVSILIDDFGVGHSSLCYFNDFPFDKVKIDKTFIFELDRSRAARAIIEAVTTLSRNLSIGVVAEGVETLEQQALLTKLGCTHLQGHLFSRAVPAEEIKRMQRLAPGSAALPA